MSHCSAASQQLRPTGTWWVDQGAASECVHPGVATPPIMCRPVLSAGWPIGSASRSAVGTKVPASGGFLRVPRAGRCSRMVVVPRIWQESPVHGSGAPRCGTGHRGFPPTRCRLWDSAGGAVRPPGTAPPSMLRTQGVGGHRPEYGAFSCPHAREPAAHRRLPGKRRKGPGRVGSGSASADRQIVGQLGDVARSRLHPLGEDGPCADRHGTRGGRVLRHALAGLQ